VEFECIIWLGERGEVPEWTIGAVSKTVVAARLPWVRIPPSPLSVKSCGPTGSRSVEKRM
jgi:hypothetical protein